MLFDVRVGPTGHDAREGHSPNGKLGDGTFPGSYEGADPNTGRVANYQFNIGSPAQVVEGTLGWNSNGTLGSLLIADPFTKANAQNCGYSYDDLARLASVSCGPRNPDGTTWGQTFSYDPLGNITKSVPPSMTGIAWQPGYNTNNQYTLGGTSYDSNGNLKADTFNTYAWDADGNTIGINLNGSAPIAITYDAFDRIVEENKSGTYTQVLYSPIGKLALMAKQVNNNVFLPLPGGEQATYTGSTIRFRHYDWLESARFESSMGEQEYGDAAYAPFGEPYSIGKTPYVSFTGQNQDTISGTYDFLYREYNPVQGRWISPDPSGLSAVNPGNPQSWNRYAYVLNNPLRYTDPLGLWCVWEDGTHDDDPSEGGSSMHGCEEQGGHWDPFNTITGIFQQNGVVTQINYIGGGTCTIADCGVGGTLGQFDQTLQSYSVLPSANAANNGFTWAWNFTKALVKGPSTGSGSCVGLFTDTVTAPLKQLQSAAKNYIPLMVAAMQSAPSLTTSFGSYMQMVGDFTSTPPAETAEGIAGLYTVAAAASTAAPYVSAAAPYAVAGGADLTLAYGLGTELKAGFNGQCRW